MYFDLVTYEDDVNTSNTSDFCYIYYVLYLKSAEAASIYQFIIICVSRNTANFYLKSRLFLIKYLILTILFEFEAFVHYKFPEKISFIIHTAIVC